MARPLVKNTSIEIRCTTTQKQAWFDAAQAVGCTFSDWAIDWLDAAAQADLKIDLMKPKRLSPIKNAV